MRLVEGDWIFEEEDGVEVGTELVLTDGRKVIAYDGCDHRDNPVKILVKLTRKLNRLGKKTHELVEIADGSDTLWYGIIKG